MMPFLVVIYAGLILVSIVATCYTLWAYHHCPCNKSHRPLIFPIICSIAWFIVSVDQLVSMLEHTHDSSDGLTSIMLIILTLIAMLYFVKNYVQIQTTECALSIGDT